MERPIKSEIKKIIDDINYHLKEVDEKLDKISHLLDSVEEASEVGTKKKAEAVKESEKQEREEVAESAHKDVYGSCPLCGSPLLVLGRAPLIVECSNVKCRNTFTPK